ncbi:hypothetical protein MWN33_15235 [Starkeya koreensis]|uniref:Uncharacterized protein n=1 Tax=Ancylobacter koreensis TaxID=266121 RepID=A0ABT0DQ44_9HYPH|nr:hypothetical protein [Ancylobacter koreensis]MCK0209388.1 hypothetical protein [Ancylobacter koreensis]
MNHGRRAAARLRRAASGPALLWVLAGAWLLACGAALPLHAQSGISDLPVPEIDPLIDPAPFDGRLAIRDYMRAVLPPRWWANEPQFSLGAFAVTIHPPDDWRGNPTSAVMRLCPPSYSVLWTKLDRIELTPFYRNATRTGVTCRKG